VGTNCVEDGKTLRMGKEEAMISALIQGRHGGSTKCAFSQK
jgi:hypothetical protein